MSEDTITVELDIKVKVWNRLTFTLEKSKLEEFKEFVKAHSTTEILSEECPADIIFEGCETLYDTEEEVDLSPNDECTKELFDENQNVIYRNDYLKDGR